MRAGDKTAGNSANSSIFFISCSLLQSAVRCSYFQKLRGLFQKQIQLIVVYPVSGFFDLDQAKIANGFDARIVLRHGGKAFCAPEQQRGRGDLSKDLYGVLNVVAVGRESADVVIKLPYQGTVGVPVGAVQGEMAGDFVREPRVGFLHTSHRRLQALVAVRDPLFDAADILNPRAQALRRGAVHAVSGGKPDAFDGNRFGDPRGVDSGVVQNDHAAERVADQPDGKLVDDVQQR